MGMTWNKRKYFLIKKYWKYWHPFTYAVTLFCYWLAELLTDPKGPFDLADFAGFVGIMGLHFLFFFKNDEKN